MLVCEYFPSEGFSTWFEGKKHWNELLHKWTLPSTEVTKYFYAVEWRLHVVILGTFLTEYSIIFIVAQWENSFAFATTSAL